MRSNVEIPLFEPLDSTELLACFMSIDVIDFDLGLRNFGVTEDGKVVKFDFSAAHLVLVLFSVVSPRL